MSCAQTIVYVACVKMADYKLAAVLILLNTIFFTCISCHGVPCPPSSTPPAPSAPKKQAKCPKDTLKFGVCGKWLELISENIGANPSSKCCSLVTGLADLEAALCLCTAIKANALGVIKLEVPVALSLLLDSCGKKVPEGFVCA